MPMHSKPLHKSIAWVNDWMNTRMHACKENLPWKQLLGLWLGSKKSLRAIYYPYLDLSFSTYKITKVEAGRLGRADLGER